MADVSAPPSPKKGDGTSPSSMNLAAGDVMDADGEFPVSMHYTTCVDVVDSDRKFYIKHPSAVDYLAPIFSLHFSYFFPSWNTNLRSHDRPKKPAYLLNLMCALAARYSHIYNQKREDGTPAAEELTDAQSAMETWSSKAKEQVNRQLAVPNLDLVEALLMISWYEFGADRDGVSF